jgi:hypothetical protein
MIILSYFRYNVSEPIDREKTGSNYIETMGLYYEYLGPKILTGFDSYKYSSKDTSPLSQYVMHPFWNQVGRSM